MIAAIDRPQALNSILRHRRLIPLKDVVGYLLISQSRNRTAVTNIKAGIRIATRIDFITANFTASSTTTASNRATYSRDAEQLTALLRCPARNCILPHKNSE